MKVILVCKLKKQNQALLKNNWILIIYLYNILISFFNLDDVIFAIKK